MQFFGLISLLLSLVVVGWWFVSAVPAHAPEESAFSEASSQTRVDPAIKAHIAAKADLIQLAVLVVNDVIARPLVVSGEARGYWFFEASFPVVLTDWDGKIIAESYATAAGDWMTEDFVPFTATVDFTSPYHAGDPDFMRRGTLILKRDNPSGLPEHDDALEIPVLFENSSVTEPVGQRDTYSEAIDVAEEAAELMSR